VSEEDRRRVLAAHPRRQFKSEIVRAFAEGFKHKPDSTFGTVNADVLEKLSPGFKRQNFCDIIAASRFAE
jgi:hypothetical protein